MELTPHLQQELKKLGVVSLYLFGSRAFGKETPLSDYDYAVLLNAGGHLRGDPLYYRLYDILAAISPRTQENDVIDIVYLKDVSLELRFHVIRYGVVLFDSNPDLRLDFEAHTTLLYCDYRPVLDRFDQTILQNL